LGSGSCINFSNFMTCKKNSPLLNVCFNYWDSGLFFKLVFKLCANFSENLNIPFLHERSNFTVNKVVFGSFWIRLRIIIWIRILYNACVPAYPSKTFSFFGIHLLCMQGVAECSLTGRRSRSVCWRAGWRGGRLGGTPSPRPAETFSSPSGASPTPGRLSSNSWTSC